MFVYLSLSSLILTFLVLAFISGVIVFIIKRQNAKNKDDDESIKGWQEFIKFADLIVITVVFGLFYFIINDIFQIFINAKSTIGMEFLGAIIGLILTALVTWFLLNRQSEEDSSKQKQEKILQQELDVFTNVIGAIEKDILDFYENYNTFKTENKNETNKYDTLFNDFLFKIRLHRMKIFIVGNRDVKKQYDTIVDFIEKFIKSEKNELKNIDIYENFIREVQSAVEKLAESCRKQIGLVSKNITNKEDNKKSSEPVQSNVSDNKEVEIPLFDKNQKVDKKIGKYTKFTFDGGDKLPKNRLVLECIKDIVKNNSIKSIKQFNDIIKDDWQADQGLEDQYKKRKNKPGFIGIATKEEIAQKLFLDTRYKRFFLDDPIDLPEDDVKYVVSNQWGANFKTFIEAISNEEHRETCRETWKKIKKMNK